MKENKKVSPSWGVCGRLNAATKSKPISLTGIGFSQSVLRLLLVLLVLPMAFVNAWGGGDKYWAAKLTATSTDTGAGRVYVGGNSAPALDAYGTSTQESSSTQSNTKDNNASSKTYTWYAYAMPRRTSVFAGWTDGKNATFPSDMSTTKIKVQVSGEKNSTSYGLSLGLYTDASVKANFAESTPFEMTYKPALLSYSVDYKYVEVNENDLFEEKVWESYSIASEDQVVQTYPRDKVILSTSVSHGFVGWFKDDGASPVKTTLSYTIEPTESAVYYPKWTASTGNLAEVNGVPYESLPEAVNAANSSTEETVTLKLLNYIFYLDAEDLVLTRSMTIDLNGQTLYGLSGHLFIVNNATAEVTFTDGGSTKGKILASGNTSDKVCAVEVRQGLAIVSGATIEAENKQKEDAILPNTIACPIYVGSNGTVQVTSGSLKGTAAKNAYGLYSQGTSTISGGTVNGTATVSDACGVYGTGTTIISGGTISSTAKRSAVGVITDCSSNGTTGTTTISGGTFSITASERDAYGVWAIDGATTINGGTYTMATSNGTSYNAYGVVAGTKSIVNNTYSGDAQLVVHDGTFTVGTASKTVFSYGIYVQPAVANLSQGDNGFISTIIDGGKFKMQGKTVGGAANEVAESMQIKGGFFSANNYLDLNIPATHHANTLTSGTEYNAGYRYQVVSGSPEVPTAVCKIGETTFNTLEDAISYANNNPEATMVIWMLKDYTLSTAGKYTIPANTTLVVPGYDTETTHTEIERLCNSSSYASAEENALANKVPTKSYRTLVLSDGVMLDVKGAIEVGGRQDNYNNNGTGRPCGETYGWLLMKTGSHILLEGGSNLYAWGFVTGSGTIDVRRGATVCEQFQIYDWNGGTEASSIYNHRYQYRAFPLNEYFVQNVEVPTTYRPGSALYGYTGFVNVNVRTKIIGVETDEAALFLMDENDVSEDTWVRKSYDVSTDQQVYEVNNSAKLGNLHIPYSSYVFKSEEYVLPITHNMKIHLLDGFMEITQNTMLLPGVEIEVNKKSMISIKEGMSLFVFDYHEWDAHIFSGKYAWRIECRPGALPTASVRDVTSPSGLGNARVNIHGTFRADGALYTTESGASIFSTNADAGQIMFSTKAPNGPDMPLYVHKYAGSYYTRPTVPALLLNTDGSFTETVSTPAGQSYCYLNDSWRRMTVDPDNSCFVYDQYDQYYAQAGEYIAINATKNPTTKVISGNNDHTYSDAAGTGRLFILVEGCQWWEVENIDNLYHCIHPQNDTYYYWVSDIDEETGIDNGTWEEKKFAISWKNWDGSDLHDQDDDVIIPDNLSYGVMPQYLHTPNPSREPDVDYTYTFDDWSPALVPVTKDQTYTATYTKEERRYVIVFKNGGTEVSRQFLKHNEMPDVPELTQDGKILSWNPMVSAVIGTQTYNAVWTDEPETDYDVQVVFKDYDGTVLKQNNSEDDAQFDVTISISTGQGAINQTILDALPTPNKKQTDQVAAGNKEYDYVFDHWSPSIVEPVTQATVYTAVYREVAKTYTVNFYKEGTTNATKETAGNLIVSRLDLSYGATPEVPSYDKVNTDEYTYTKDWVNMSNLTFDGEGNITTNEDDWVKSVSSVIGNADYVAVFKATKNRYTITAKSEDANEQLLAGCTFSGTGTYDYDSENAITLTAIPNPGYEFVKWKDNNSTDPSRDVYVISNTTYIAVVREASVEVDINESQTIARPTVVRNLIIHTDAESEESGQLIGAENITLVDGGNAYFDLTLNTWARHWNAFAVPFEVDLKKTSIVEVKTKGGVATNRTLRYGRDYDIVYYKESERVTNGPSYQCWDYVDSKNKVLTPGEAYLIAFTSHVGTIRFTGEQDGDHHIKVGDGVTVTYTDPADPKDGGWNGIGNPRTYHALLNAGVTECQIHNGDTIGSDSYLPYEMTNKKFVVGKAAFVKVGAAPSVVVERATNQSAITPKAAPRRAKTITTGGDRYTVEIMPENGKIADRLFLLLDEEKPDEYMDGKDLPKAGVGSARAQMWVNRYNAKLCKNTVAPTDGQAEYPLGIYAPKAGEYTIYIAAQPEEEQALYLTKDGKAIWNLSDGAYTLNLERGTTTQYGLRVSAKGPQVATGVDEAIVDAHGNTQKVLINNQVYIIRGDKVYSIDGQLVK